MRLLAVLILMIASACASLGLPSPSTFNERLAAATGTVTEVRNAADTLLIAKKISSDDAQNIQNQADNVRQGLNIARSMSKTDLSAANTKLTTTLTVLTALQAYIATKKGN